MKSSSTTKPQPVPVTDESVVEQIQSMREDGQKVRELEKMPRERYAEREALFRALGQAQQAGRLIGNYESLLSEDDKRALGSNMREVVTAIYGEHAVQNVLLKGIDNPHNKIEKRLKFLKFLEANLVARHGKTAFRKYKGEYDPKKSADATVKMDDIFSDKGVELYREAVREEGESAAFRLALAYVATQYFQGPKLQQLMYVWVGGASGSGKSFGAGGVIEALLKHMPNFGEGDIQGNYFSFVDGGIARKVSQVRKLALKMALRCGFSSIEDLNDISGRNDPLDLKKVVHNTAVESGRVNVIIPETFSDCVLFTSCKDVLEAEKLTRKRGMLHVFSEVAPAEGKVEEFKTQLVPRMAGERANAKKYGKDFRLLIQFEQLNVLDLPCESKAPPSVSSIGYGMSGTALARDVYFASGDSGKNAERYPRIHIVILNQLMYVDYLGVNQSLRLAASDFANYQKAVGNTPTQQLSLQTWYEEMEKAKKLAPANIVIERFDVDADRREFCELTNQASRAAGLAQAALTKEKSPDRKASRQSESVIQASDPEREELIRRLAHFAHVLEEKNAIPSAARAEMLDLTGKRICQLVFTGVPKGGPTVGAEINVVRDDCRKFAEWMALLNRAVRHSLPDVQAEARRLLIKEWQAQILQSYAPIHEKAQALQELHLCAKAFLTQPQVNPAANVAALIRDIESNMQKVGGAPINSQPNKPQVQARSEQPSQQSMRQGAPPQVPPQAPPRTQAAVAPQAPKPAQRPQTMPAQVVKQPIPPQRPADPVQSAASKVNSNAAQQAPIAPTPAPRSNSAPPVKQDAAKTAVPTKHSLNPSVLFPHAAPPNSPNRPPARPKQTPGVPPEETNPTITKGRK